MFELIIWGVLVITGFSIVCSLFNCNDVPDCFGNKAKSIKCPNCNHLMKCCDKDHD